MIQGEGRGGRPMYRHADTFFTLLKSPEIVLNNFENFHVDLYIITQRDL